jgi:hypothetical protein
MATAGEKNSFSTCNPSSGRKPESESEKLSSVPSDVPITRSADAASMLCCYNLPDYRLEHPDFTDYPVKERRGPEPERNEQLKAEVPRPIEQDREATLASPIRDPGTTPLDVYCNGCNDIQLEDGSPRAVPPKNPQETEAAKRMK